MNRVLGFLFACFVWVLDKLDEFQHWLLPNARSDRRWPLCVAFTWSVAYFHAHFCRDCREEDEQ